MPSRASTAPATVPRAAGNQGRGDGSRMKLKRRQMPDVGESDPAKEEQPGRRQAVNLGRGVYQGQPIHGITSPACQATEDRCLSSCLRIS